MMNMNTRIELMAVITTITISLAITISWCFNVYKFTQCDFKGPWNGEVLHGAGVIMPPIAVVTVWFNDEQDKERQENQ